MKPSETLVAAADLIRDLAAKATPGQWAWRDPGGREKQALMAGRQMIVPSSIPDVYPSAADARWIAALSPALADDLSALLVALDGREFDAARVIAQRLSARVLGEEAP